MVATVTTGVMVGQLGGSATVAPVETASLGAPAAPVGLEECSSVAVATEAGVLSRSIPPRLAVQVAQAEMQGSCR